MKQINRNADVERSIRINHFSENKTNNVIIARDQNIESIRKQFDNTLLGGMGISIVTGKPGIGKTCLVESTEDFFLSNGATYVKAKFKQYSKGILTPIISIIDTIIEYIFTLPFDTYKLIQNNYRDALKNDCEIILSLCPQAVKIFGKKSDSTAKMNLHANQNNKISEAVYQFIKVSSKLLFPLVIFLDDLQWADSTSLNILKRICQNDENLSMHVILAYRDNENINITKELTCFGENKDVLVKLHEFNKENVSKYIISVLGDNLDNKKYLTETMYSLTSGNPFYINIIMTELIKDNIVVQSGSNNKYCVDIKKLRKHQTPKDIRQMIISKIEGIQEDDRKLLEIIACFGGVIEYNLLGMLAYGDSKSLNSQLERLCNASILIKEPVKTKDYNNNYMFIHDIIYNVVYESQRERDRDAVHLHILNTLIEHKSGDYAKDNSLFMASLLLGTEKHLLVNNKIHSWINILHNAGILAKNMAALDHALKIYELCDYLILKSDIQQNSDLYLNIQLDYMECQFISENKEGAKRRYEMLIKSFSSNEKRLKIKLRYINFYAYSANWEMVNSLGIEILKNLNYSFNTKSIPFDLLKSRMLYNNKYIEKIKDAPMITNQRILTILEVLTIMFPAANRIDLKKFTLLTLKLAILTAKYGSSEYSAIGYASYCYILYFVFKDYKKGTQLQKITMELLKSKQIRLKKSIAYALIGTFTYHWTNSFESTVNCLSQSIEQGEQEDEYLYSNYAVVFSIITKYIMGRPLVELRKYINSCKSKKKRLENYLTRHMYEVYLTHITYLEKGYDYYHYSIDENKQSFYDTIVLNAKMIKVHRLYLEGKLKEGYALVNEIEPLVWKHNGFVLNGDFAFYSALTRISIHNSLENKEKKHNKKIIEKHLSNMKTWADVYKNNHYARYLLMQAEYDFYLSTNKQVENYYYRAMVFAKQEKNVQLEALANLLAAKHYRYNIKLSRFYAKEASLLYKKWGANYIAELICEQMGIDSSSQNETNNSISLNENKNEERSNVLQYISKMKNMPESEVYTYILDYIVDKNYANYCLVLFEKNGEMYAKYDKRRSETVKTYKEPVNMNYIENLPHTVIRYVARTENQVLLCNKDNLGIFRNDTFLSESDDLAVACVPIKCSDILIGTVYLEIDSENLDDNICDVISGLIPTMIIKEPSFHDKNDIDDNIELTAREVEILKLVNEGLSNSQISEKTFITVGTVRNHLSKIYSKLDVNSRVQAIVKAKDLDII